jgi:hypothetical protein
MAGKGNFNIHQRVFDEYGEYREKAGTRYAEQLMDIFAASSEGQARQDQGSDLAWSYYLLDYGMTYLGVTPPDMTPTHLKELLFEIFPRKITADPECAPEVIRDLQGFWAFLKREFQLENADPCLSVLDARTTRRFAKEMGNPDNFGMAKSLMMGALERGFDVSSHEGLNDWIATYNAELASSTAPEPLMIQPAPSVIDMPPAASTELPSPGHHKRRRQVTKKHGRATHKAPRPPRGLRHGAP